MQVDAPRRRCRPRRSRSFPASRASSNPTARDGVVGYEVDSERGHDVRRELARAVVAQRLGPARAAADAHEPGGDLPVADDRRDADERPAAGPQEALANE